MSSLEEKVNHNSKTANFISFLSLVVAVVSAIVSYTLFTLNMHNSPLIIEYQNSKLAYGVSDSAKLIKNNTEKGVSQTPSVRNITGDNESKPVYINECNTIFLDFYVTQGSISKAYKIDFGDNNDLIYSKAIIQKNDDNSFFKTNDGSVTISIPLQRKDLIINDTAFNGREFKSDFNAPGLQRFALAILDYNDNLSIYYFVLRPLPVITPDSYSIKIMNNEDSEKDILITSLNNWTYEIVFIDCSISNSKSAQKTILEMFDNNNGHFHYDEATKEYVSTFTIFSKEHLWNTSAGVLKTKPKSLVVRDSLSLDNDFESIKNIPKDKLN